MLEMEEKLFAQKVMEGGNSKPKENLNTNNQRSNAATQQRADGSTSKRTQRRARQLAQGSAPKCTQRFLYGR